MFDILNRDHPFDAVNMNTSNAAQNFLIDIFWNFSSQVHGLRESERLQQIKAGFSPELVDAMLATFDLSDTHVEILLNKSLSTLKRRKLQHKTLDSVTSERLDRIASIVQQALEVFESRAVATRWMTVPNLSLGYSIPLMLCSTGIGAVQVLRVLHALEWGGAA